MKDHEVRETVNKVRDIANHWHNTTVLREKIAKVLVPILKEGDSWTGGEHLPTGGFHCVLLIGSPEDDVSMCHTVTGFYTQTGWMVFSCPINLRLCEMRAWGDDITVRAWKRFDR